MRSYTTERERPDEGPTNIKQTKGVWLRRMNNGDYEVFRDGEFIVSFGGWNEHIAAAAMEQTYQAGFRDGKKANQKHLRDALGLKP
jgi:hypothetical protein